MAASFGRAALFLVEEIEGGSLDKLRATPITRSAIVIVPRSLILDDMKRETILPGFAVVAVRGAIGVLLNVRMIGGYD